MNSILSNDGEQSSRAKRVNIATAFNEFRDTLFNKTLTDIKWKEFKAKAIKLEHTKSAKYHYLFLIIKGLF